MEKFNVYIRNYGKCDLSKELLKKINNLLKNKDNINIVSDYPISDQILWKMYNPLRFAELYSDETFYFNILNAIIFIGENFIDGNQDLLELARENNLKIRIIKE